MAYDDFEDGTVNRWTELTGTGGSFVASVTAKKEGNYGGLMTTNGANTNNEIIWENNTSSGNTGNFYAWLKTTNVAGRITMVIQTSGRQTIAYFSIDSGDFRYYDGSYKTDWITTPANDTWYRVRMDIDNSSGGNIDYYLYDAAGNEIESKLNCTPLTTADMGIVQFLTGDRSASVETVYWDNVTYTDTAEPTPPTPSGGTLQTRKYW